jgi:hypothetical protein
MTTLEENLKAFIQADGTPIAALVGNRVYYNHVDKTPPLTPYIFFAQRDDGDELCLDDAHGEDPFRYFFDFEYIDRDPFKAKQGSIALRRRLNKHTGTLGDQTIQFMDCTSQEDNYETKGTNGNSGLHSAAFIVEVIP